MKLFLRRKPRTGVCRNGCGEVPLNRRGLVENHRNGWYYGGRRKCYGSGQTPKAGA